MEPFFIAFWKESVLLQVYFSSFTKKPSLFDKLQHYHMKREENIEIFLCYIVLSIQKEDYCKNTLHNFGKRIPFLKVFLASF